MMDASCHGSGFLATYAETVARTDVLGDAIEPVLQGLFAEIGGVLAAAKKQVREGPNAKRDKEVATEEFGDALWYFAAVCRRSGHSLESIFDGTAPPGGAHDVDVALFSLGRAAVRLFDGINESSSLEDFAKAYSLALSLTGVTMAEVAEANRRKVTGIFLTPSPESLCDFDESFSIEEQLPRKFEVKISQRLGRTYLQWNGVFIGDPLTDNIADADGYRFHDVFHLAYAAILHWSPVFRALIKQKRKSDRRYDEEQDSGRAIVVEEGVTVWLFEKAKELDFFRGRNRVPLGILKTIEEFTKGYEVSRCPLNLWQTAILEGYSVFLKVRDANGGWVIGDRDARTITFKPLDTP